MRTQVAIIGAGPAGLVLAHLLHLKGIDSWVLERQSRSHIEQRIRAGVLEPGTVDLLQEVGLADRLMRERIVHEGLELLFEGIGHRLPLAELAGREITIYGQHELVKDLVAARLATERPLLFEVSHVTVEDVDHHPRVSFVHDGLLQSLDCDFIGTEEDAYRSIRGFAKSRKLAKAEDTPSRLYAVEALMTLTGANADHRLRVPASAVVQVAAELAGEILRQSPAAGSAEFAAALSRFGKASGIKPDWIASCAKDLLANAGNSLVLAGHRQHDPDTDRRGGGGRRGRAAFR